MLVNDCMIVDISLYIYVCVLMLVRLCVHIYIGAFV